MVEIKFDEEKRGGWDEWGDPWKVLLGFEVIGDENSIYFTSNYLHDGEFITEDGRNVNVSIESYNINLVTLEIHDPEYKVKEIERKDLKNKIKEVREDTVIIDF